MILAYMRGGRVRVWKRSVGYTCPSGGVPVLCGQKKLTQTL